MTAWLYLYSGVIIGVILHYGFPSSSTKKFYLATDEECNNDTDKFQVADRLLLSTQGDEFICTVDGKVFKNNKGDRIEQSVRYVVYSSLHILIHFVLYSCCLIQSCSFLCYCLPLYFMLGIV